MVFDKQFVAGAVPGAQVLYDAFPASVHVCVDSRTLRAGDFFVACAGTRIDGHTFVADVLGKGAAGAMIAAARVEVLSGVPAHILKRSLVIAVPDTMLALWQLAAAWRAQFAYPVVGITGSVGKTTTREMVCNILSAAGISFVSTEGNLNSLIGLPMSILNMRDHHQAAVFEVGISQRGDMARAVDMLRPTVAAITTIGHSHMEGLGSLLDISAEKREIFKYFKPESIGIINGDQAVLAAVGYRHPVIKCGAKTTNQVQARKVRINGDNVSFVIKLYKNKYPVRLAGSHEGIVFNSLVAAGVACVLGIDPATIVKGIQVPVVVGGRFQRLPLTSGRGTMINDCYNASPESLKAALIAVEHVKTEAYKVAVIGDMLELGVDSPFWHRQIGRFLRKAPSIREVILVGSRVEAAKDLIPEGMVVRHVLSADHALDVLKAMSERELLVLVKASHGMHLDAIVDACTKPAQRAASAPSQERPVAFAAAKRVTDDTLMAASTARRRARTS